MFTGLVEDLGTVARTDRRSDALVMTIRPAVIDVATIAIGESIAHDGACLTVTARDGAGKGGTYEVLAGAETLARTTLELVRVNTRLHLERALAVGGRLGGHMMAGHVDGVGDVVERRDLGANLVLTIGSTPDLLRYIVVKGSIAVDGVSLTVNSVDDRTFSVALIPHTVAATTLGERRPGHKVNLEVDLIAKYVEKLFPGAPQRAEGGHLPGGGAAGSGHHLRQESP